MNKVFKWNNAKFQFSIANADTLERYKKAMLEVSQKIDAMNLKEDDYLTVNEMKQFCGHIDVMFDQIFGEGSAQKMFSGEPDMEQHMKAFHKLINLQKMQQKDFSEFCESFGDTVKNSPQIPKGE